MIECSPAEKDLGGTGGWEAGHEPAMCPRSPESQLYPGLHQKQHGQQGEGRDPAPVLCFLTLVHIIQKGEQESSFASIFHTRGG